jgi:GPI mannosyltransferase 1 subunit X
MMLLQPLPAAVFVNTDELLGLKKLGKVNTCLALNGSCSKWKFFFSQIKTFVPVYVDVELPTSKASAFPVYIYSHIKNEVNISLPIHFRYHLPGDKK